MVITKPPGPVVAKFLFDKTRQLGRQQGSPPAGFAPTPGHARSFDLDFFPLEETSSRFEVD
jgi:hypothetical protein